MTYPNPALKSFETKEGVLAINAPRFEIRHGKDVIVKDGKVHENDGFKASMVSFNNFFYANLSAHPIKEFRISCQELSDGKISISTWWEAQNVILDKKLQPHYTKYEPTLVLEPTLTEQEIRLIFAILKKRIPANHPNIQEYVERINAQEHSTLVLMGIKKVKRTVNVEVTSVTSNVALVVNNISKIKGENASQPNMLTHAPIAKPTDAVSKRGEVTIEDENKTRIAAEKMKVSPIDSFLTILTEIDEEVAHPNVSASFHEAGIKEKTFLKFIVSISKYLRKQGTVADSLWKFYANKFTEMISNFFGKSVFKDEIAKKKLKELWTRIRTTTRNLANSPVLDRISRTTNPKMPTGEAPKSFQERAMSTKNQILARMEKEKEEKRKKEAEAVAAAQKAIKPAQDPQRVPEYKPKSMWERTKDRVSGFTQKLLGR